MSGNQAVRPNRKKRGGGFGKFILGWFIGFICTLLLIGGLGFWAYKRVNIKKIEKWIKTDITNNKGIENKTIEEWVAIATSIAKKDSSAYTISKFEEDFGVTLLQNSMYGIDLTPIKTSPIKDIKQGLNTAIDSATFNNVLSFMEVSGDDLGLLNTVLDSEITYYIKNGKLYTANNYTTEVGFKYEINGSEVKIGNVTYTAKDESTHKIITPTLRHIPLETAMSSMEDATQGLKIYEVLGYYHNSTEDKYYENYNSSTNTYSNELTGILGSLAGYSVGDLSNNETFNGLYIYEVMGYTQLGNETDGYTYEDEDEKPVTGIMARIAGKTIKQLSADDAFNDIVVADAMGYYWDTETEKWYTSTPFTSDNEVEGVIKHLAGSNLKGLSADIQNLTVGKILDVKETDATGVVKALYSSKISTLKADIEGLTLGSALGVEEDEATGVIRTFYNEPINTLASKIKDIKIWQALGYYEKDDNGVKLYYLNYNDETKEYLNPVTGMMATLAPYSVNDLSNSDTFNDLYIYEVKGYRREEVSGEPTTYKYYETTQSGEKEVEGIIGMIAGEKLGNIQTAIQNIIDTKTVNELISAGVITATLDEKTQNVIGGMTIPALVDFINDNIDLLVPTT